MRRLRHIHDHRGRAYCGSRVTALILFGVLASSALTANAGDGVQETSTETAIPTYVVQHTDQRISVDGRATEKCWQDAQRVPPLLMWDGKPAPDITECKLLWDDRALYVLFVCQDADIQASFRNRDEPLYQEDVVEVFIDADADEKTYMELIVNPLNTVFDNYLLCDPAINKSASVVAWTCTGWTTAVKVDGTVRHPRKKDSSEQADRCWTVEMRIPFATFVLTTGPSGKAPRDGDVWRAALTRYDRPDGRNLMHYAWSPPYSRGWPHVTRRFGRLVFRRQ